RVLAQWRGETISVEPTVSNVGTGKRGEQASFMVSFKNYGGKPVQIMDRKPDCFNVSSDDLPVTLQPGEERSIKVQSTFSGGVGRFQHPLAFFTNTSNQPLVRTRIAGRVVPGD